MPAGHGWLAKYSVDACGALTLMDAALAAAPRFDAPALFLYGGNDEVIPRQATKAVWGALPPGPVRAFYPGGYHLLLRDLEGPKVAQDVADWVLGNK